MFDNSTEWLIGVLEPVRELLHHIEEDVSPDLHDLILEARMRVDREIENLKQSGW